MLKIIEYKCADESLIKEWNILWETSPYKTFFNSYLWFDICLKTFGYNQVLIFAVREDNELKGILPLVKKKKYFVSPGEKYLDNTTLLIKNKRVLEPLIDYIKQHRYRIILNEVENLVASEMNVLSQFASNNPRANLSDGIDKVVKPKELRYIRRIREKNVMHINFEVYQGENCRAQINRIFKIEERSSKPNLKRAIFISSQACNLFINISKTKNAFLIILKYDDLDIAHLFCLEYGNTIMAYHMAYNSEYSKLQPGKLVLIELMDYMCENDYNILDFSRGDSTLKRHFSNKNIVKFNMYINCGCLIKINILFHTIIHKIKNTIAYKKVKKLLKDNRRFIWNKKK